MKDNVLTNDRKGNVSIARDWIEGGLPKIKNISQSECVQKRAKIISVFPFEF